MFIRRLQAQKFAEVIYVSDDLVTGGNIGEEQVELATVMIALGGGRGVSDRAHKMRKRRLPILPFELQLGGFSDDGVGAIGLHKAFFSDPLSMLPITGEQVKSELDTLFLQEPIFPLNELAEITVGLFQAEREAEQAYRTPDVLILTALSVELAAHRAERDRRPGELTPPVTTGQVVHACRNPRSGLAKGLAGSNARPLTAALKLRVSDRPHTRCAREKSRALPGPLRSRAFRSDDAVRAPGPASPSSAQPSLDCRRSAWRAPASRHTAQQKSQSWWSRLTEPRRRPVPVNQTQAPCLLCRCAGEAVRGGQVRSTAAH